jgi:NADPH-dependent curcumin reductase CurA
MRDARRRGHCRFDSMPHAFMGLFKGETKGMLIVKSAEPDEG